MLSVLVILLVLSSSSGQQRGGRGLWDQFPGQQKYQQRDDSYRHMHTQRVEQHRGSPSDSRGHQALSRRLGVASADTSSNDGGLEDRSRAVGGGGGFWGQMATSNQDLQTNVPVERTEINANRNKRLKEQIMPRTKSDTSVSLEKMKSLIKRVKNAKTNMKSKQRKKQYRQTSALHESADRYHSEYEYEDYEDERQRITGEESRQDGRQERLGHR